MRKKGLEVQTDGYKGEPKGVEKDWGKKWIFFSNTYFFSRHSTYSFFFLRLSWAEIWVERQKNIRETCCFFKLLWRTVCVVISIRLFGTQVNLLRWSWFLLYNISPAPFGVLARAYWCQEKMPPLNRLFLSSASLSVPDSVNSWYSQSRKVRRLPCFWSSAGLSSVPSLRSSWEEVCLVLDNPQQPGSSSLLLSAWGVLNPAASAQPNKRK